MEIVYTKEELAAITFKPGRKIYYSDILIAGFIWNEAWERVVDDLLNKKNGNEISPAELGRWTYTIANVFLAGIVVGVRAHKCKQKEKIARYWNAGQFVNLQEKERLAVAAAKMWPKVDLENIKTANYILNMATNTNPGKYFINRDSYAITSLFIAGQIAGAKMYKRKQKEKAAKLRNV